jgi:RND family efflux transporter MFP subunit
MKVFLFGSIFIAASALISGCHSDSTVQSAAVETAQARVVESRQQQAPKIIRTTGTLHARETAVLSAQVVGRVQQVLVHEGDNVAAGQTLVVLDDSTLRASAEQAEAAVRAAASQQAAAQINADLAASTLARYKQLQAQKSVSPQEMDEVTRRAEAATAQVASLGAQGAAAKAQASGAAAMLGYTRIRAPFAGVITSRTADPGALAAPGVPLLQIDSAGSLQFQTTVDESAITAIHNGMKLPLKLDAMSSPIEGTVAQIVPAADPASHTFLVKIDLPSSKQVRAGMYGSAEIATGTRQAIVVPRSAIVMRGSLPCAYVLDSNGIAQLRYVTLGHEQQADLVEVLSGISAAEKLVDDPADRDLTGKRIEIQSGAQQ